MRAMLRSIVLCLGLLLAAGPVAAQDSALSVLVERMVQVQQVAVDGSTKLERATTLDYRISKIYFDEKDDPEVDAVIDAYERDVAETLEKGRATLASLDAEMGDVTSADHRSLIEGMIEVIEILHTMLEETPVYLRDLLKASREGDAETFDRLSAQSTMRSAALLRTESALIDIQQMTVEETHPTHALLGAVKASNEGLALFAAASSRMYGAGDARVEETAELMRAQVAEMRAAIKRGEGTRNAMLLRLFLPAMRREHYAALRSVFDVEFGEAFAIEAEHADHLDALADAMETIYDADIAAMEALDARTLDLANRRIEIRQTILRKLQTATNKMK